MINLSEHMDENTIDLVWSLSNAGIKYRSIIIFDNGWLADNMVSPFSFYSSAYDDKSGRALFFNEVPVQPFWGIRGNNELAEVYDNDTIRSKIFYHENREVERVEWWNTLNKIVFVDHYNCYGRLYAKTYYHHDVPAQKSYFSSDNHEIINHNLVTNQIMLSFEGKNYFFTSLTEFVVFFIKQNFAVQDYNQIIYNSLSTPLFIVEELKKETKGILVWDEPLTQGVPGNMAEILSNHESNTTHIFFQRQADMRKIHNEYHFSRDAIISYLGKTYDFTTKIKSRENKKNILIVTSSDDIWQLEKLVESLPQMNFKIMALTEMSDKLTASSKYENVELFPIAEPQHILDAVKQADYLLDINNGPEVLDVVKQAFLSHTLILSVENRTHHAKYIASEHIFTNEASDLMIEKINITRHNMFKYGKALTLQENIYGPEGSKSYYAKAFKS